jgi:IS5 family transposase
VNVYLNQKDNLATGASNINPLIVLSALIVKHMLNISDEESIQMVTKNLYIQQLLGYFIFTLKAPFNSS